MYQLGTKKFEMIEDFSDMSQWATGDNLPPQEIARVISRSQIFRDRHTECSDAGWIVDMGETLGRTALPSPPPSTGSHPNGSPQYELSPRLDDDVVEETASVTKERRRVQNKRAQQAFRQRKELQFQRLENQVTELKTDLRQLTRKYHELRAEHLRLQSGLKALLFASNIEDNLGDMSSTFDREIRM